MADESIIKDKGVSNWLWWIPVLIAVIGLVIAMGVSTFKHPTSVANKAYEYEHRLSAGKVVYTKVIVGKGTNLRLWASNPFYVIAGQQDGTITEYWMPDGESSWIGGDPVGLFTLKGETDGTIVRIKIL